MGVSRLTTANWSCVPYCRPHWPQLQPIALLADTSCNLFTRTGICRNSKHRDRLLAKVDHPSRVAQWFQSHLHLCWQQRPLASSKSLANQGRGSPDTVLKTEFGKIPRIPLMLSSGRQGDRLIGWYPILLKFVNVTSLWLDLASPGASGGDQGWLGSHGEDLLGCLRRRPTTVLWWSWRRSARQRSTMVEGYTETFPLGSPNGRL